MLLSAMLLSIWHNTCPKDEFIKWNSNGSFSSSLDQCSLRNHSGYYHYCAEDLVSLFLFTDVVETSHRNNEKLPTLSLWILFDDHNLCPHPQGFWLPLVCLHVTRFWFSLSPVWVCALGVCLAIRPRGERLHILAHLKINQFFWLWNKKTEAESVPWTSIISILLPEICLIGAGQAHVTSPTNKFCSDLRNDGMLQCVYNGLMVPVGLTVFWNANKHGVCAAFHVRICGFFCVFLSF